MMTEFSWTVILSLIILTTAFLYLAVESISVHLFISIQFKNNISLMMIISHHGHVLHTCVSEEV